MRPYLFCFWTDHNAMSDTRLRCFQTLARSGLDVQLITPHNLHDWVLPGAPLHAAYQYLSAVHRADYLRSYFMHYYGGGYSDIKYTTQPWVSSFDKLNASNALGIGYREVSRKGVAHIHRNKVDQHLYFGASPTSAVANFFRYHQMRWHWRRLIGNCAYIFKPNTAFTLECHKTIEARLDFLLPLLEKNPACFPRDAKGAMTPNGPTKYPMPWSFICADVFHPLVFRYRFNILRTLPPPEFRNYI